MSKLLERITINPRIFGGKPIIRGLRISVEMILDLMSQGVPEDEILKDFPLLAKDDLRACLVYAKELVANEALDGIQIEKIS